MKYTVITTFHQAGLELYGQKMIDSFEKHWPDSVQLVVYAENCSPVFGKSNITIEPLLEVSKECKRFVKRHKNNPRAHGIPNPDALDSVNSKKAFRWEAVRFCYKVFATAHAIKNIDSDWIIWLDADSKTHTPVTVSFLENVCPENHMITYLGRGETYHSECGWVAYNKNHPLTESFVEHFVGMYEKDEIFNLKEWHDSYVWDHVRKIYRDQHDAKFYNLNPEGDSKGLAGHPFINSELGLYLDHMKGDRKHRGHSKAKEVKMHADHPYWKSVLNKGK